MNSVEQLNATWEGQLTSFTKQLWENLKVQGVTAKWEHTDRTDNEEREADPDSFFEFVVLRDGREVGRHTKVIVAANGLVIIGLIEFAKQLESEGVRVMPS